jgi:hypothetical protein
MGNGTLNASSSDRNFMTVIGVAVVVLAGLWLLLAPPAARAGNFCQGVNLARYGQPGDRCTAPEGGWMYYVVVETSNAAGCETTQNNGVLLAAWTCTGSYTFTGSYHNSNNWSHGIIRNNNTNVAGTFWGAQSACPKQGCAP